MAIPYIFTKNVKEETQPSKMVYGEKKKKAEKPWLMPTVQEMLIFQLYFTVWCSLLGTDSLWHVICAIIKASSSR